MYLPVKEKTSKFFQTHIQTVCVVRASPGHRQYRQMLGASSSAGGATNVGEKTIIITNKKHIYIYFTSAINTIILKYYISPQQHNVTP